MMRRRMRYKGEAWWLKHPATCMATCMGAFAFAFAFAYLADHPKPLRPAHRLLRTTAVTLLTGTLYCV